MKASPPAPNLQTVVAVTAVHFLLSLIYSQNFQPKWVSRREFEGNKEVTKTVTTSTNNQTFRVKKLYVWLTSQKAIVFTFFYSEKRLSF